MPKPLPVWVEIHVDDEILARQPQRWRHTAELLEVVTELAQTRGASLCLRVREAFATLSASSGFLPGLVACGHEVGVHAHGRRLAVAHAALVRAGVTPAVAVPGLVQAGAGRGPLLRQVAALGMPVVCDHGAERAWAYEGLLPRDEQGVRVLSPTVRPFDWGLMEMDGTRHGLTAANLGRLRDLEAMAARHGAHWFGAAFHEHDLCPRGSLRPDDHRLEALADYLDERVVPVMSLADAVQAGPAATGRPPSDRRVRATKIMGRLTRTARQRLPDRIRPRVRRESAGEGRDVTLSVDGRTIAARRHGPPQARAICVCSVSGPAGGRAADLAYFGLGVPDLTDRGWAVWVYDRSGTGSTAGSALGLVPGNPDHVDDWTAVLQRARAEGPPVIALSWSAGIIPVLRAAADGHAPDALVDGEAPVDRWSLFHPKGHGPAGKDPWCDEDWDGIEAVQLVGRLGVPYARLQAADDHVHGPMHEHARRIVAAARASGCTPMDLEISPGKLHDHSHRVIEALEWALGSVKG